MASETNVFAVLFDSTPIKEKPEKIQKAYEKWIALQAPAVEGVFSGVLGSMQGAFLGTLMGSLTQGSMAEAQATGAGPTAQMMQMGGPLVQARNFAVMTGTNAGINAFMRRYRKVDDIQNALVAAFGSGACFSLVSGMGSKPAIPGTSAPNPLMGAFSAGVVFALFQGAFYKLGESWSGPKTDDTEYARVKAMLAHLGFSKYEKNLKRAHLNDQTLLLWDTAALQEAKIPAGPRLLILNHIATKGRRSDILNPSVPIGK
jgi:hypothetical protein